jgi:hypothetical protein
MAARRLAGLCYEDWIEHVFSHEVALHGNAWHWDPDADLWDGSPAETLAHLIRFLEDPLPALAYFSNAQIDQGLRYLIDNGAGDLTRPLREPGLPLADRRRGLAAMRGVFEQLFQPRCTPHLSHLDEAGAGPLNGICYMWWDSFPGAVGERDPHRQEMAEATLATIALGLSLDSVACQESALHGLGHWGSWAGGGQAQVAPLIDAYLAARPGLRPELAAYARAARSGCVL